MKTDNYINENIPMPTFIEYLKLYHPFEYQKIEEQKITQEDVVIRMPDECIPDLIKFGKKQKLKDKIKSMQEIRKKKNI